MSFVDLMKPKLFLSSCLFLLSAPVVVQSVSGHDWQRAAQCLLALLSFVYLLTLLWHGSFTALVDQRARYVCTLIVSIGLVSALRAHQTQWAFAELALLLACCATVSALALQRGSRGVLVDRVLINFVLILCIVKIVQFIAAASAAFVSGVDILDTTLLFDAFSNRRAYGQFQTFTLPLLALPLLSTSVTRPVKGWIFVLLSCWWMIAICGGTRGTWLGMAVASVAMLFCGSNGLRWVGCQMASTAAGFLLYWLLFSLLPSYLDIRILHFASDRFTTNLSARDVIWQQAWEMIKTRPLLGYGPMQFADIPNVVAAHPHQLVLQWASEWGIPSALMVGALSFTGLTSTVLLIRRKIASAEPVDLLRICLFASLIGALTQGMVDGVIVMPYSQLWLCVTVGWLLGMHEWRVIPTPAGLVMTQIWFLAVASAVLFLGYVVVRDLPNQQENRERYSHDFGGNFQPRFWMQGVIATTPQ